MGGDDVLDLRAVLGFLQAQGIDQDALVGYRRRQALQLFQLPAATCQLLQNGGIVKAGRI